MKHEQRHISDLATPVLFACILALFCAVHAGAQGTRTIYKELLRPPGAVYHHVPIGLCEDYPEESTTKEIIRGDMEVLKRTGVHLLRIAFGWDGIQPQKGAYDWLFWDDYVKTAVDEYGITLIPYICYTPRWNSTGDTTNYWNHPPTDYEAFGTFVATIVNRYKKWIHSWELWNEPDIRGVFWSGTAEDLAKLTKIGAQAVKKTDPEALVVLAGLAVHTEFTRALFRDYGISPYVDVVNCHDYPETWNSKPVEEIVPYVDTLAAIIRQYGRGQSLWMAEVGYSSFRTPEGSVSAQTHAIYDYEHTEAYQAQHLLKSITLDLSTQKLAAIAWYRIKDLKPAEAVIGDQNNRYLGIVHLDYSSKPAEQAISFANKLFSRKLRCIDGELDVKRTACSESEIHAFQNEDGSVIIVGWLKTQVPGKLFAEPVGTLKDYRKEVVSVTVPGKVAGQVAAYNERGEEKPFTGVRRAETNTTLDGIALTGGTVVVITIGT